MQKKKKIADFANTHTHTHTHTGIVEHQRLLIIKKKKQLRLRNLLFFCAWGDAKSELNKLTFLMSTLAAKVQYSVHLYPLSVHH